MSSSFPHTAISSWSGYIYQGKIALYHVLKLLAEGEDSGYELQLDSLEDFSILFNGRVVSLHQVKAKKSDLFSGYIEAFEKLKGNSEKYFCDNAQFHLSTGIRDKSCSDIESECRPVKIYCYHDGNPYCKVKDVESFICFKIKKYYEDNSAPAWKLEDTYIEKTKNYLDKIIVAKILYSHAEIHAGRYDREVAFHERVKFEEFKSVLDMDLNSKGAGSDYYLFLIKRDIQNYYLEFCVENSIELCAVAEKLNDYLLYIEAMDDIEIIEFIKNIMPHREFKFDSLSDYKNSSLVCEEFKDAFLEILRELAKTDCERGKIIWNSNGRNYGPTTINAGRRSAGRICERIVSSAAKNNPSILYEIDSLITSDISVPSLEGAANNVVDVEDEFESRERIAAKITNWKKVSLVNIDSAKRDIND
ncbi:ABC-three component system protein [Maridesulfovibrio sp.]|uniref:ABC-three component system protein n=1 Tax=Maridesulfovibrio sp. TaxID=2795000 RepID=UPI003B00D49D